MATDDALALAGRLFLALIFLASAFGKITNFEGTLQYMEAHGVPAATFLCLCAVAVEVAGAASLILGYKTRWGAALLAGFLAVVTWVFHISPDQRVQLLKNLAILGGLLYAMAFGPGPISLDGGGRRP